MKALIFILMLWLPLIGLSQKNVFDEWKFYLKDCNTLIPDTVIQSGTVNVEYKPVMANGKISHFILAPIDTVWEKVECNNFKYGDNHLLTSGSLYIGCYTSLTSNYAIMTVPATTYSTSEAKSTIIITRKKICQIKQRKASWEDFWNRYCKKNKIIEFN